MPTPAEILVARRLAELHPTLVTLVAEDLAVELPAVGLDKHDPNLAVAHHQRMRSTAERFHAMLQVGLGADWGLLRYEYEWAARALRPLGITWEHQLTLIASYVEMARSLAGWDEAERAVLDGLVERLRAVGEAVYQA